MKRRPLYYSRVCSALVVLYYVVERDRERQTERTEQWRRTWQRQKLATMVTSVLLNTMILFAWPLRVTSTSLSAAARASPAPSSSCAKTSSCGGAAMCGKKKWVTTCRTHEQPHKEPHSGSFLMGAYPQVRAVVGRKIVPHPHRSCQESSHNLHNYLQRPETLLSRARIYLF